MGQSSHFLFASSACFAVSIRRCHLCFETPTTSPGPSLQMLMNKTKLRRTLLLAFIVTGFAGMARGAGHYFKVDYPVSSASNELQVAVTYTVWLPEGVKTFRGIIVHQHGAGTTASIEGSTAAYDLH